MEELQPAASSQEGQHSPVPSTPHKDRRTWLVLFGIVELLIAAFFGFMAALMMALPRLSGNRPLPPELPHGFWFALAATYVLIGLLFVAAGIGSILAKNWARLLMLFLSWCWLVCGIFAVMGQILFIVAGRNFAAASTPNEQLPPQFFHTVQIFTSIFTLIAFVLVPLTFIIFYSRKSVKAACQRTVSIAERERMLPTAVWILVVLLGLHATGLLWTALFFPALGFFGYFVTGLAARVTLVALAAVWAWLVWSCYRRDLRGWWVAMGFSVFLGLSNVITNLRHSVDDIYRAMNFPMPPSTPVTALFGSATFRVGLPALFLLVYLGFLLYTKRYFPETADAGQAPALN